MKKYIYVLIGLTIFGCTGKKSNENSSHSETVKLEQYMVKGQQLYTTYCSNCHQASGEGLAQLFPPLKGSDFMKKNKDLTICSMKNGLSGEITVNGVKFNQMMPGIPTLTELEIAEIATYIYNTWGDEEGIISTQEVSKILAACKN